MLLGKLKSKISASINIFLLLCVTLMLTAAGPSVNPERKLNPETRALWVTRFELMDKNNIAQVVKQAADANFNTLFVQVSGRGTALYDSRIMSRDSKTLDFDPLATVITEARKYNINVHAWINTLYVWSDPKNPAPAGHVVNTHPEWIMTLANDPANKYLDPAIPAVREYVKSIYLEVAKNYAVDGVHLDYIRYPGASAGYTAYTRQAFAQQYGADPQSLAQTSVADLEASIKRTLAWDNYRREAVSTLVRSIYRDLSVSAPTVLLTAAVLPDAESAKSNNFQDWASWMRDGYIDAIVPMVYDVNDSVVQRQTAVAAELSAEYSVPVLIGLGAWRRSADEIIADVRFVRNLRAQPRYNNVQGVALFSYDGIKNPPEYLNKIKRQVFTDRVAQAPVVKKHTVARLY